MKNNLGFTMTELLAAVVILGILMTMGVTTISNVLRNQKNNLYIEDARRLGTLAEKKIKSDNKIIVPGKNKCIVMRLDYLDDGTFDSAPYENSYDKTKSFVIIKRLATGYYSYNYYVRLVEPVGTSYRGIGGNNLIPVYDENPHNPNDLYLYKKNIKNDVSNYSGLNDITTTYTNSSICTSGVEMVYVG